MPQIKAISVGALLLAATLSCSRSADRPAKSLGIENYPDAVDLYDFAERERAKHGLPALGVGVVRDGKIVALGLAGERRAGSGDWATLDHLFDVASCAKSVTATVAAVLVEQGTARWDMTVAEVFPELADVILPDYRHVTIDMLLRHRGGLDQWMSTNERWQAWHRDNANKTATEKRLLFVKAALKRPPRYEPGTDAYYCNDGYLIVGSMLERISGKPWEALVRESLFEPLGLASMRFGVPPSEDDSSALAWGHDDGMFGRPHSYAPDPEEYGDPPFGSPGGFLYTSIPDLLRYVDFHIQGANGKGKLLSPESFTVLQTPHEGQHFALGWEVEATRDDQGRVVERSIYHGGYSGRARANMWFCPESRLGMVIVYNHGGHDKVDAYAEVFYALLQEVGAAKEDAK